MAVYWLGADGNVWFKGSAGVQNMGKPVAGGATRSPYRPGVNPKGFDAERGSAEATLIADPNPPRAKSAARTAPQNPNARQPSTGGGGSAPAEPAKVDRSGNIVVQRAGLDAVDAQTNAGIDAINRALNNLLGDYSTEAATNEGTYRTQSDVNQGNFQRNKQSALINAAQGRRGLFGTLSSLGALSGSGVELANQAVQKGATEDLTGASETFGANQSSLDTSIGQFRQQNDRRKREAEGAAENARTNTRGNAARDRMQFLSNIANDYSAMGDEATAQSYRQQVSALYPEIAKSNIPNANIVRSEAAFTPGTLQNYIAGADSTLVQSTPASGAQRVPGLVAGTKRKRDAEA